MQAKDTDRIKVDDYTWRVECHQCGQAFEAKRSDASFCSARCRVAFSREPQKLMNAIAALKSMATQAEEMSRKYKHSDNLFEAMIELQKRINGALGNFEK